MFRSVPGSDVSLGPQTWEVRLGVKLPLPSRYTLPSKRDKKKIRTGICIMEPYVQSNLTTRSNLPQPRNKHFRPSYQLTNTKMNYPLLSREINDMTNASTIQNIAFGVITATIAIAGLALTYLHYRHSRRTTADSDLEASRSDTGIELVSHSGSRRKTSESLQFDAERAND